MDLIKLLDIANPKTIKDTINAMIGVTNTANTNASSAVTTANEAKTLSQTATTNSASAKQTAEEALAIVEEADTRSEEASLLAEQATADANDAVDTAEFALNTANAARSAVDQALNLGQWGTFTHNTNGIALAHAYMTDSVNQTDDTTLDRYHIATPKLVRDALNSYYTKPEISALLANKANLNDIPVISSDTTLSTTSENVVQNKVITNAINNKVSLISDNTQTIINTNNSTATVFKAKSANVAAYIALENSNNATSSYGVNANQKPVFHDTVDHELAYTSELNKKADNYNLTLTHNVASTNNEKYLAVKFLTINYSDHTNGKNACIKLKAKSFKNGSIYNYGDRNHNFTIDEDIIIQKDDDSAVIVSIHRYTPPNYAWSFNNYRNCTFGDIFWTTDTTNKVLTFYMFCGEYSSTQFTPFTAMGDTVPTGITQHTGTAEYYSNGAISWAQYGKGTTVAFRSDIQRVEDSLQAVMLEFCFPVGSYYFTENPNLNTETAMHNHFGGTWVKLSSEVVYAVDSSSTDVGRTEGDNSVSVPIKNHTHNLNNSNVHFNEVWGQVGRIRTEGNHDLSTQGVCYPDNTNTGADGDFWDNPDNDWRLRGFAFKFTPSLNANQTNKTESAGDGASPTIDVRGRRRRCYGYRRTA